jgi:hypothetical protein
MAKKYTVEWLHEALLGARAELSLVQGVPQSRRNMTEWSASDQRHWPVNPQLRLNYNINLQLSRGIYITLIHSGLVLGAP